MRRLLEGDLRLVIAEGDPTCMISLQCLGHRATERYSVLPLKEGAMMNTLPQTSSDVQRSFKASVDRMGRALSADVANGVVGAHHNTYQHRLRVLRQITAKLNSPARIAGVNIPLHQLPTPLSN